MTLRQLNNKIKLFLIKREIKKNEERLHLYVKYMNYYPIGQRKSTEDPFGEENWNE